MNELANTLRMYAEDIHSVVGHSDCSTAMSQAADRLEELEELEGCDDVCREIYKALDDVPYKGSYADGVEFLKARIAELEKENEALKATNDELKQVRCEGCGYLVSEREHLGCHSEKTLKELEAIAAQNEAMRIALNKIHDIAAPYDDGL